MTAPDTQQPQQPMRDPCEARLWDIVETDACPVCGAPPDARCLGDGVCMSGEI